MPEIYPIAIIGGGPVGLGSSILLSQQKIPHILFERYPSTSIDPKAVGMNMRTIEIFRQMGIEPQILQHRAPGSATCRTAWYTSLGPNGREIIGRDAWGRYHDEYQRASPCLYTMLPQIRLEPILMKRAIEMNPHGIKYGTEVTDVKEEDDRAMLTVHARDGSETCQVEASYVIGADGGRGLTDSLGINWNGEQDIVGMVSAHIQTPLSLHHPDPRVFITWFIDPLRGGSIQTGYLYHLGPYPATPETEEWVFACAVDPKDPEKLDEEKMVQRLHDTLQIPDLKVELKSISHWQVNSIVSERYRSRQGRIFLVGDAAHRVPPWGALGLNTGIQDAHNLTWKLGLAVRGDQKGDYNALLDTYETERKPVRQRVAKTSLHNLRSHGLIMDRALGISPSNDAESNVKALQEYWQEDSPEGTARREAVREAQVILDDEFHAIGAEIGWFYPSIDPEGKDIPSDHDGQVLPSGEMDCLNYHPTTLPRHNLPHAWLEKDGVIRSTRDFISADSFLLLSSVPYDKDTLGDGLVRVECMGDKGWKDTNGMWANLTSTKGVAGVLIRPDGIVAWRAIGEDGVTKMKDEQWLSGILQRILRLSE